MDASLRTRAEQLASEIAGQAETADDLNSLMRLMMKSAMERMLDTEMDVHLGRRSLGTAAAEPVSEARAASYWNTPDVPLPKSCVSIWPRTL